MLPKTYRKTQREKPKKKRITKHIQYNSLTFSLLRFLLLLLNLIWAFDVWNGFQWIQSYLSCKHCNTTHKHRFHFSNSREKQLRFIKILILFSQLVDNNFGKRKIPTNKYASRLQYYFYPFMFHEIKLAFDLHFQSANYSKYAFHSLHRLHQFIPIMNQPQNSTMQKKDSLRFTKKNYYDFFYRVAFVCFVSAFFIFSFARRLSPTCFAKKKTFQWLKRKKKTK